MLAGAIPAPSPTNSGKNRKASGIPHASAAFPKAPTASRPSSCGRRPRGQIRPEERGRGRCPAFSTERRASREEHRHRSAHSLPLAQGAGVRRSTAKPSAPLSPNRLRGFIRCRARRSPRWPKSWWMPTRRRPPACAPRRVFLFTQLRRLRLRTSRLGWLFSKNLLLR
jgi:hypothetical protein